MPPRLAWVRGGVGVRVRARVEVSVSVRAGVEVRVRVRLSTSTMGSSGADEMVNGCHCGSSLFLFLDSMWGQHR